MQLYPIVLLAGALDTFAIGQESCRNILDECYGIVVDVVGACEELELRMNCRLTCNACDGYDNPTPLDDMAVVYGGNHILTWDGLPFDCTGSGEFILYSNSVTGMKVHALFKRPEGTRTSVTTAVAAISSTDQPRLQIAVNRGASRDAQSAGQCVLIFWIKKRRLTEAQVNQLGGFGGIARIPDAVERFAYKMDLRSGARVEMSLRYGSEQGCYFDRVQVMLTEPLREHATGLLGTPDNNIHNDWQDRNGNVRDLPNLFGRYFSNAYNYATDAWCVRRWNNLIIKYDNLGSFHANMKCTEAYDGFTSTNEATEEMLQVCGELNVECLHDSLSTDSAAEGIITIKLMEEVETNTAPVSRGLGALPRGIRQDVESKVKFTVKLNRSEIDVYDLNGFGLFRLNEMNLHRSREVLGFLSDDGDGIKGDAISFDGIFTDLVSLNLGNGEPRGFIAVPLIRGTYRYDMPDLLFSLPNAVRGYSRISGRDIKDGERTTSLESLGDLVIEVRFKWPAEGRSFIAGVRLLDDYVGGECHRKYSGPYLECDCAKRDNGEDANVKVETGLAYKEKVFDAFTTITFYGFWQISRDATGSRPITIEAVLKRDNREFRSLRMSVVPPTLFGGLELCPPSEQPQESLLGGLTINLSRSGEWLFTMWDKSQEL